MCHVRRPITQDINGKQTTTKSPWAIERVQEATKLNAETRDPPSQDPRDHKEQPSRHDIHPDTLEQTPTKPGHNKVVRKTTAVKQESET